MQKEVLDNLDKKKEYQRTKKDTDFEYLDGAFVSYLQDQTNYLKVKTEMIEVLMGQFIKRLDMNSVGMIPSHDLIEEFTTAIQFIEKAHARLAIELMRLKAMQLQSGMIDCMVTEEKEKEKEHDPAII